MNNDPNSTNQNVGLNNQPVNPTNQNVGLNNQPVNSTNQNVGLNNQPVNPTNQNVGLNNQPVNPTNQNVGLSNQPVNPINQNVGLNNQPVNPTNQNVGLNNQPVNPINQNVGLNNQPMNQKNSFKNKKTIIIIVSVVAALILLIITLILLFGNKSTLSGNSVGVNETINVRENGAENYDYSIKVDSVEPNQKIDDETYTRVKLTVTNNSNASSTMGLEVGFSLLNSKNKELATSSYSRSSAYLLFSGVDSSILLDNTFEAKETKSGYLYFKTNSEDIDKLEIWVAGSFFSDEKTSYYIDLK